MVWLAVHVRRGRETGGEQRASFLDAEGMPLATSMEGDLPGAWDQLVAGDGTAVGPAVSGRLRGSVRVVNIARIALWLSHRSTQATNIYEHSDQALKEQGIARTAPLGAKLVCVTTR